MRSRVAVLQKLSGFSGVVPLVDVGGQGDGRVYELWNERTFGSAPLHIDVPVVKLHVLQANVLLSMMMPVMVSHALEGASSDAINVPGAAAATASSGGAPRAQLSRTQSLSGARSLVAAHGPVLIKLPVPRAVMHAVVLWLSDFENAAALNSTQAFVRVHVPLVLRQLHAVRRALLTHLEARDRGANSPAELSASAAHMQSWIAAFLGATRMDRPLGTLAPDAAAGALAELLDALATLDNLLRDETTLGSLRSCLQDELDLLQGSPLGGHALRVVVVGKNVYVEGSLGRTSLVALTRASCARRGLCNQLARLLSFFVPVRQHEESLSIPIDGLVFSSEMALREPLAAQAATGGASAPASAGDSAPSSPSMSPAATRPATAPAPSEVGMFAPRLTMRDLPAPQSVRWQVAGKDVDKPHTRSLSQSLFLARTQSYVAEAVLQSTAPVGHLAAIVSDLRACVAHPAGSARNGAHAIVVDVDEREVELYSADAVGNSHCHVQGQFFEGVSVHVVRATPCVRQLLERVRALRRAGLSADAIARWVRATVSKWAQAAVAIRAAGRHRVGEDAWQVLSASGLDRALGLAVADVTLLQMWAFAVPWLDSAPPPAAAAAAGGAGGAA